MGHGREARHIGNPRLRDARHRRHWTEDDVAVELQRLAVELGEAEPAVDASQVSKWERGVRTPGRHYRPRLCLVFESTPQQLGFEPSPRLMREIGELAARRAAGRCQPERPQPQPSAAVHGPGSDLLPESAFPELDRERLSATLRHLWPVDRPLLAGLERAADRMSYRADTEAPHELLTDLMTFHATLLVLLERSNSAETAARIKAVGSRAAQHTAFLWDVDGDRVKALTYWAVAETLARESGDQNQLAMVLVHRSEHYSRRSDSPADQADAVALTEAAAAVVGADAKGGVQAWIWGERALQEADRGNDRAAGQHLDRAMKWVDAGPAELNIFSPDIESSWLQRRPGTCALRLGRADDAIAIFEDVLRHTDPRLVWERLMTLVELASAWACKAEIELACSLFEQAAELAHATGNERGLGLARRARRRYLGRWSRDPRVRRLDEAMRPG